MNSASDIPVIDRSASALVLGMSIHGLAIARSLARHGIDVHAFEQSASQPSRWTRHARIHLVDGINSEYAADILLQKRHLLPAENRVVLFPSSDNMVRSIAARWDDLAPHYALSWATSIDVVTRLVDKSNLAAVCEERDVLYPRSALIHDRGEAAAALDSIGLPALVKPIRPLSGFKAVLLHESQQLVDLVNDFSDDLPFLVQRWIPGSDDQLYFCSMLLDNGKPLQKFTGRKLRSFPAGTGVGTIVESCPNDEVLAVSERFISGLGLSGPIAIEYKRDDDGRYWLIEPNVGRTEYSVDLIIQSGLDFPLLEYQISQGHLPVPAPPVTREVIWYDTEREPLAYLDLCRRLLTLRPYGKKPVFPYAGHQDLQPLLRASARLARRLLSVPGNRLRRLVYGSGAATIRSVASFDALPPAAIRMLQETERDNLFIGPGWFENYEHHVARFEGEFSWACIFDDADELRGVWPLVLHKQRGRRFLRLMGNYYTPYATLPFDFSCDGARELFISALKQVSRRADWVELAPVAPDDAVMRMVRQHGDAFHCVVGESTINWFQQVASAAGYREQLPGRVRSTLRRKSRSLARETTVDYRIVRGDDNLEAALDDYFDVYGKSWKPVEPYPEFIRGLARLAAREGWLRLGLLYVDNEPAAAQIWLVRAGTAHIYKLAYANKYVHASVGTLLTWHMVESTVAGDNVTKLDYLTGNDSYKKDWMNESRVLYTVAFLNVLRPVGALRYLRHWISDRLRGENTVMRPTRAHN